MERTANVKKIGEKYRETGKDQALTKSKRDKKLKKKFKKSEKELVRVLPNTKGNIIFSNDRKKVTKIDKSLTKKITKKSQKQIIK